MALSLLVLHGVCSLCLLFLLGSRRVSGAAEAQRRAKRQTALQTAGRARDPLRRLALLFAAALPARGSPPLGLCPRGRLSAQLGVPPRRLQGPLGWASLDAPSSLPSKHPPSRAAGNLQWARLPRNTSEVAHVRLPSSVPTRPTGNSCILVCHLLSPSRSLTLCAAQAHPLRSEILLLLLFAGIKILHPNTFT